MKSPIEKKRRVLLFGKNGQLGSSLFRMLRGDDLHAFDYPEIDFLKPDQIVNLVNVIKPNIIINAAAYTAVDKAETDQTVSMQINGSTVGAIAEKAKEIGAGLVHYSTDYVFNGKTEVQYKENDEPDPINFYGLSKLSGEQNITAVDGSYFIFRLSWVYSTDFPSFVTKVLEWSRKNETLKVVDDQISKPSWSEMLAEKTLQVLGMMGNENIYESMKPFSGIYHMAGQGEASRYDWALEILENDPLRDEQITSEVIPVKSTVFPTPAERPLFSVLDCTKFEKTFNLNLPHWKDSLSEAMLGKSR